MIMVRTTMNVLPEKHMEVMQTLLSLIETTLKEKGCLRYDAFCDISVKTVFNLIEEWKTREDLDRHMRSQIFSVLLGTKSLLAKPLEMKIHTVSHSEGTEVVKAIRVATTFKRNA